MSVYDSPSFDAHELVHFETDARTGLQTIIAVHSTSLGPACGGCRLWNYPTSADALEDALRLSRGMSYKNAMADIPLGGGKAVIISRAQDKSPELMRAFGRVVDSLGGRYVTAEDVGVSVDDMVVVAEETSFVHGLPKDNSAGGDPSPYTAQGVFLGMKAALKHRFNHTDFQGVRVLVQGVGHVGYNLCKLLHKAGAEISIADVSHKHLKHVSDEIPVKIVAVDELHKDPVDIFAPCALGAVLNDSTIPRLKAKIIAGGANNQLSRPEHGMMIKDRGILYAPDYVINAGGIINVWSEMAGLSSESVCEKVSRIYNTTLKVLEEAESRDLPTDKVADEMACEIIQQKAA
jgi:leucine dehydrogenase